MQHQLLCVRTTLQRRTDGGHYKACVDAHLNAHARQAVPWNGVVQTIA